MNTIIDTCATLAITSSLATLELAAVNAHSPLLLAGMMVTLLASGGWLAGHRLQGMPRDCPAQAPARHGHGAHESRRRKGGN